MRHGNRYMKIVKHFETSETILSEEKKSFISIMVENDGHFKNLNIQFNLDGISLFSDDTELRRWNVASWYIYNLFREDCKTELENTERILLEDVFNNTPYGTIIRINEQN